MSDASGTTSHFYDDYDRLAARNTPLGNWSYARDAKGNLLNLTFDSGIYAIGYAWDPLGRLAAVKNGMNLAIDPLTTCHYDPAGNLDLCTTTTDVGGAGNISAECAALLHQLGHRISALTRGRSPVPPQFRAVTGDRKDAAALRQALAGLDLEIVLNFLGYELADVQLDFDLFRGRVRQYVFISSATVYAKPPPRLPITEDAPLGNPWWDYAQKKLACENWLLDRWRDAAFPVTIVRPSHTYSKHWIPNPVSSSSFTVAARLEQGKPVFVPDDGQNPWTLTAASDFATGLAGLLGLQPAIGEAFHITSDEVLTWNQIYAEIAAALGVTSPQIVKVPTDVICQAAPQLTGTLKGDKSHPGVFDNSKIKRFVPGFRCAKPFRVGVRESVAWLRAHPENQNLKPELDALIDRVIAAHKGHSA